ncbi:MAG: OmpH family outer membrane protein [Bacteroidota bacterium]|nr:OmpH family outer membrane protein [Bacteroidota bacterium]
MKKFLTILFISVGIFGFSTTTKAQKIGYISADEVIQLMPEAATVQKELDQYQQSLYQNAQDKQAALNDAIAKFVKDSSTLSPSMKEVRRNDLQKQSQDLAGENQRIQDEFAQKRQELSAPIQKKLQDAIEAVAKENGYTYIMPKEALIVMPPANDIGPLVIKKLGLKQPSAATTPAKP